MPALGRVATDLSRHAETIASHAKRTAGRRAAGRAAGRAADRRGRYGAPKSTWRLGAGYRRTRLDAWRPRTYVLAMTHPSGLTEERLASLYVAEGFGGEKTMRAMVIRELIDENPSASL